MVAGYVRFHVMQTFIVSNPRNIRREVASETVSDSGRGWQVMEGETRKGEKYYVALMWGADGCQLLSASIFGTRDEALQDMGCY